MSDFYKSMTEQPESTAPGGAGLASVLYDNTVSSDARRVVEDAVDRAAIAPEDADRTARVLTRELSALGLDATLHARFLEAASRSAPEGVEADLAAGRTARALHERFGAGAGRMLADAVEWAKTRAPGIASSLAGSAALVDPRHAVELVRAHRRATGRG